MATTALREVLALDTRDVSAVAAFLAGWVEPRDANRVLRQMNDLLAELLSREALLRFAHLKRFRKQRHRPSASAAFIPSSSSSPSGGEERKEEQEAEEQEAEEEAELERHKEKEMLQLAVCTPQAMEALLEEDRARIRALFSEPLEIVHVPVYAPRTVQEAKSMPWPASLDRAGFKPPPDPLAEEEVEAATRCMRLAAQDALRRQQEQPGLSGALQGGAVIVRSDTQEVVCSSSQEYADFAAEHAHDRLAAPSQHPLMTPVMLCIAGVARQVRLAREQAQSAPLQQNGATQQQQQQHNSGMATQYVCYHMDVYATHEPDVMTTMGLVHSRVRRVFYALRSPTNGGLGSVCRLHTAAGLNHEYRVFEGLLAHEVRQMLQQPADASERDDTDVADKSSEEMEAEAKTERGPRG